MKKMTFKEYLDSKSSLSQAVNIPPVKSTTYVISKYCKLPVGTDASNKEFVSLRPKQQILINIHGIDADIPGNSRIIFNHVDISKSDKPQSVLLSSERLGRWLLRNTTRYIKCNKT